MAGMAKHRFTQEHKSKRTEDFYFSTDHDFVSKRSGRDLGRQSYILIMLWFFFLNTLKPFLDTFPFLLPDRTSFIFRLVLLKEHKCMIGIYIFLLNAICTSRLSSEKIEIISRSLECWLIWCCSRVIICLWWGHCKKVSGLLLATPLLIQLCWWPRKAVENGPKFCHLALTWETRKSPESQLWTDPALAIAATCGVNQKMGDCSVLPIFSLYSILK